MIDEDVDLSRLQNGNNGKNYRKNSFDSFKSIVSNAQLAEMHLKEVSQKLEP